MEIKRPKLSLVAVSEITADTFNSNQYVELVIVSARSLGNKVVCEAKDLQHRISASSSGVQTINVHFSGPFAEIEVKPGDLLQLEGSGIKPLPSPDHAKSVFEHPFYLSVEGEQCSAKVTPIVFGQPGQAEHSLTLVEYSVMEPGGALNVQSTILATEEDDDEGFNAYKQLGDLKPNMHENVFGVVIGVTFPTKTKQDTVRWAFRLIDDSLPANGDGIEVTVFQSTKSFTFPVLEHGSVVRLHCVKTETYRESTTLRSDKHTTMAVMSSEVGCTNAPVTLLTEEQSTAMNWARVDYLREYFAKEVVPNCTFNQYTTSLKQLTSMREMPAGFVDVVAIVKSAPSLCLYELEICDAQDSTVKATVRLNNFEHKDVYWPLVVHAVGAKEFTLIKIRDCQICKQNDQLVILAMENICSSKQASNQSRATKTTSFMRLHNAVHVQTIVPPAPILPEMPSPAPQPSTTTTTTTTAEPVSILPTISLPLWKDRKLVTRIHQNASTLPLSLLSDVTASINTGNGPFRVRVKLIQHFPSQLEQFAVLRPNQKFQWAFALLLEDLTGRIEAYVTGKHGNDFFELPACNLVENNESLHKVQRCMEHIKKTPLSCMECVLMRIPNTSRFQIKHTILATL